MRLGGYGMGAVVAQPAAARFGKAKDAAKEQEALLKELETCKNIDPRTRWRLVTSYKGGPIEVILKAAVDAAGLQTLADNGFTVRANIGDIILTGVAKDLKSLVAVAKLQFVSVVEGGQPMWPEGKPPAQK